MSKINRHPVRRTAAGVLASALALSGAVAVATPASAGPNFALDRIAGDNRYETSARIAEAFGPTTGAILASGETGRSVDALSANFLAGVQGVPVLLTQRDRVPAAVMARLNALTGAKNVTIVGGTVAVSAAVETQLRGMGFTVTRLGGADRYATSEAIITAGRASASPIGLVASGLSFPDALAGAPLSYKGKHPVFLTSGQSIPQDTIDAMVAAGTRQVIILGGTAAVPASVEAAIVARGITVVTRLGGAGRSETSRIVADYLINNQGFTNTTFNVASGAPRSEGVDALSGGALSGKQNRALLITDTQTQGAPVVAFARDRAATLNATGNIFGGPAAVSVALEEAIEAAGRTVTSNQTFAVAQTGGNNVFLGGDVASRTRTFTATVPAGTSVDIQLFAAANVQVGANGVVTFTDADGNNVADQGTTTGATITSVNGVPGATANAVVSGGTITFTVVGESAVNVVPVIFADTNNDNQLNLTAPATGTNTNAKTPSEPFAIGATTNFLPPLAALGNQGGGAVTLVSAPAGAGFFTSGTNSFTFDENDVFQYQGVAITRAQFESLLASGATVLVNFNPSAAGASTFNVQSVPLAAPAAPTATVRNLDAGTTANDVQVTYTRPAGNPSGTTYTLQRSPSTGTPTFTNVTTATSAAGTGTGVFVFTDLNVPNGTYVYRVVATGAVTGATQASAASNAVTVPAPADTARPTVSFARLTTSAGLGGTFDAGDVITVVASEGLRAVAAGNVLRLRDADGTVADVIAGTNATFSLNTAATVVGGTSREAGTVLTVTLTAAPTGNVAAGTAAGLQVPATIIDASGLADVAGNTLDVAAGTGRDVEVEPGSIEGTAPTTPTQLTVTSASTNDADNDDTFDNGEAFTITFSRALNPTGIGTSSTTLTITDADGTRGQVVCASDCVLNAAGTVLTIPNGAVPDATTAGSVPGFQGTLVVNPATGLVAADNGQAVSTPFNITV